MPRKVTKKNNKQRSSKKTRRQITRGQITRGQITRGNQEGGSAVGGLGAVMVGGMTFMTVYPFAVLWGIQKMFGVGFPKKIKKEQTDDIDCEAFLENFETVKKYLATKAVATSGYGVLVSELKSLRTDLAIDGFLGGDNFEIGDGVTFDSTGGNNVVTFDSTGGNNVVVNDDGVTFDSTGGNNVVVNDDVSNKFTIALSDIVKNKAEDKIKDTGKSRSDINKIIVREIERKGHNDDRLLGREAKISDFDYDVDDAYCILPVAEQLSGKVRTSIKQSVKDRLNKISHILHKCKHALEVCQLCYIKTRQKSGGGKLPPKLKKAFDVWENERKYGQTQFKKMVAYELWYKRFRNRAVEFMAIVESIKDGHTLVKYLWSPFEYETWFETAIAAYKRKSSAKSYTYTTLHYTKEALRHGLVGSPMGLVPTEKVTVKISFPYYQSSNNREKFLWDGDEDSKLKAEIKERIKKLQGLITDYNSKKKDGSYTPKDDQKCNDCAAMFFFSNIKLLKTDYIKSITDNCHIVLQGCINEVEKEIRLKKAKEEKEKEQEKKAAELKEKEQNEQDGKGSITQAESNKQIKRNDNLGRGVMTDAEVSTVAAQKKVEKIEKTEELEYSKIDAMTSVYNSMSRKANDISSDQLANIVIKTEG